MTLLCLDCAGPLKVLHPDQPPENRYGHTNHYDAAQCDRPKERPWPIPKYPPEHHRALVNRYAPHSPLRTNRVTMDRCDHLFRWRLHSLTGQAPIWRNGCVLRWHPSMGWSIGGVGGVWTRLRCYDQYSVGCYHDYEVLIRVGLDLDVVRWHNQQVLYGPPR